MIQPATSLAMFDHASRSLPLKANGSPTLRTALPIRRPDFGTYSRYGWLGEIARSSSSQMRNSSRSSACCTLRQKCLHQLRWPAMFRRSSMSREYTWGGVFRYVATASLYFIQELTYLVGYSWTSASLLRWMDGTKCNLILGGYGSIRRRRQARVHHLGLHQVRMIYVVRISPH